MVIKTCKIYKNKLDCLTHRQGQKVINVTKSNRSLCQAKVERFVCSFHLLGQRVPPMGPILPYLCLRTKKLSAKDATPGANGLRNKSLSMKKMMDP